METQRDAKKLKREGNLEAHMRAMVNSPDCSDVVFLCNDGKQVPAHRMILVRGSEVLKCMLSNGMKESRLCEIELPQFSSTTLLAVFEFLYTWTTPVQYCPQSWTTAGELMEAARFFLLLELEPITLEILQQQIVAMVCARVCDFKELACLLTEALQFDGLSKERDTLLVDVVKMLSPSVTTLDHILGLSEDAFNYLLVKSKVNYEDADLSYREYQRFRQIIYWWVCKSDLGSHLTKDLKELVDSLVPEWPQALARARSLFDNKGNEVTRGIEIESAPRLLNEWRSWQLDVKPRNSALRLLSNINCRLIPPILISKVVEPLNIIPPESIQDSFRFHALQKSVSFDRFEGRYHFCWDHGDSFKISEKGRVLQRATRNVGLAVMEMPLPWLEKHFLSTTFEVAELCEDSTELGLFHYPAEVCSKRPKFDGERLSDQADAKVLKFQGSQAYVNVERPDVWKRLQYQSVSEGKLAVTFVYDGGKHTLSLVLNGQLFDSVWKNLPSRVCYQAVSFGNSSKGRIRCSHPAIPSQ